MSFLMSYDEIVNLAKEDVKEALIECKIAISADPENGDLWGLRASIEGML